MSDQALAIFGDKTATMPSYLTENTSNLGNEELDQSDLAIPRLDLLQAMSKACQEIDGAKPGLLYNSVTNELYEHAYVLNLKYVKKFVIFMSAGTGFKGEFDTAEAAEAEVENLPGTPADYAITEVAKHLCLLLDEEGQPKHPVVINLKSTGMSISKTWNSAIKAQGEVDRFATVWQVGATKKSANNNTWFVMNVEYMGWASEELHAAAKEVYESVSNMDS